MKNYPASRVRALAARFGVKALAEYLSVPPRYVEQLKSGSRAVDAREKKAFAKLARSQATEHKLLRLDAADLATRAGVSLKTAKGWQKAGTMGTSSRARGLLLTSHVTGSRGAEPGMKKPRTREESYQGHTTRGRAYKAELAAPVLLTGQTIGTIAGWLQSLSIPARWRGRGSSYLITGVADAKLTQDQVGPGSRGHMVQRKGAKKSLLKDFILSSGKQSNLSVAISEFLQEAHDSTQYETTLKKLELKVYRDN